MDKKGTFFKGLVRDIDSLGALRPTTEEPPTQTAVSLIERKELTVPNLVFCPIFDELKHSKDNIVNE